MPPSWLIDPEPELPYRMRLPRIFWLVPILIAIGILVVVGVLARNEMRTSKLQAEWFSTYDSKISFKLEPGLNTKMRYPSSGPYNQRLGYSYLPFYIKALQANNFIVAAQMRPSATFRFFQARGLYPIYRAKTVTGLTLYDRNSRRLYDARYPKHVFTDFNSIPPLLVKTLLYIENRELLAGGPVTRNPVIEWDRFAYAAFGQLAKKFIPGFNAGGGSTLATQIEKFRYSPGGETGSPLEKLRQIASASLRVYLDGPDTRAARRQIVLDYLNSTPLSARPGFGEINSIGDGLWAWFGIDLNDATAALNLPETDADSLRAKARVYRAALGLILSQRRPSYYLLTNHAALDDLTDAALDHLAAARVISPALHDAAKMARFGFLPQAPPEPQPPFTERKAVDALRNHLLSMLGLRKLYEVDRLDLAARTTLDEPAQQKTAAFLKKLDDPKFVQAMGLYGFRLLNPDNDLSKIKWSVVLYEKGADSNKVLVQADNIDAPFDMNEDMKLDLGSTAKLRTLVTYLEIIGELHRRYAGLSPDDLRDLAKEAPDPLTSWATTWLLSHPRATLKDMLEASTERTYSASPREVFFTGGGEHVFHNFEREEDGETMDLHEAFRRSVNLVFIRVMRDIVNYTIAQGTHTKEELLDDPSEPARLAYLQRFADSEGSVFLNRFINDYSGLTADAALGKIADHAHRGATARTILFRSVRPQASFQDYATFMAKQSFHEELGQERLEQLYDSYPAERYNLSDRAYITGLNPLELWLVGYLQTNPHASRRAILEVSQPIRIESYAWLFQPRLRRAQDVRIRIMLEEDAFARIQKRWARLGYPFDHLVPSLATAIGSSADRPGALAELVGIILNNGVRLPTLRFESLEFGQNTPFETLLVHDDNAETEQVLAPDIARVMKSIMTETVAGDGGTAKRVKGVYKDAKGDLLPIGGKTGTGDQRYDEFGAGGKLLSSRVMNRTGTFVFYIGDRFFGAITAHVAGEDAAKFKFSSALAVQLLKDLAPVFEPLINEGSPVAESSVAPQAARP